VYAEGKHFLIHVVRLEINLYRHKYYARIQWAGILSDNFNICNGVRQGGILISPLLFAVYIDELSLCLHSANIGCRLSNMIINHLLFADDAVVFAPSAKGLQQLLHICSNLLYPIVLFSTLLSHSALLSSQSVT